MARSLRVPFEGTYVVTNDYGDHLHYSNAPGIDWALPPGTPVYAAATGTVTWCEWGQAGGRYVIVDHGSGFLTLYSHLSWVSTVRGEVVEVGSLLGLSGSPTKVLKVDSVVLETGEFKEVSAAQEGVSALIKELVEEYIL